jgi:lipid-binding SYLF domain-containing protein
MEIVGAMRRNAPVSRIAIAWLCSVFLAVLLVFPGSRAEAASAVEIDAKVNDLLTRFYKDVGSAKELSTKAKAVLTFPSVIKAGFGIGGEFGEGALRINDKTVDYYSTVAASIGFQFGVQTRAVILMFMTDGALTNFRSSDGWEVGVDASVALVTIGAGVSIDTTNIKEPVIGFIFGEKGLMYNLSLEGSKMTKLDKK